MAIMGIPPIGIPPIIMGAGMPPIIMGMPPIGMGMPPIGIIPPGIGIIPGIIPPGIPGMPMPLIIGMGIGIIMGMPLGMLPCMGMGIALIGVILAPRAQNIGVIAAQVRTAPPRAQRTAPYAPRRVRQRGHLAAMTTVSGRKGG